MFMNNKLKLSGIKENELMAGHTTFKIGGPAKFFYVAKTSNDLIEAIQAAQGADLEYFILGNGSNVLVSDDGFDGLVIKVKNEEIKFDGNNVFCGAGMTAGRLLGLVAKQNLSGLEFMAGIPSTVGGAVCGNAGAFGRGFGEAVREVEIYQDGKIFKLNQQEMKYSYRESALKRTNAVVLNVKLELKPGDRAKITEEIIKIAKDRAQKIPTEPSAGCIFKNIELNQITDLPKILKSLDITEEEFNRVAKFKLPISYILDRLDLKGKTIGGAQISKKLPNFIINLGNARAEHVLMLISDIKMRVRNEVGIQLQEEIVYAGF